MEAAYIVKYDGIRDNDVEVVLRYNTEIEKIWIKTNPVGFWRLPTIIENLLWQIVNSAINDLPIQRCCVDPNIEVYVAGTSKKEVLYGVFITCLKCGKMSDLLAEVQVNSRAGTNIKCEVVA